MLRNILSNFTIGFLGGISMFIWLVIILNPLWFREHWINLYYKSNIAIFNPILAFNLF